MKEFTLAHKRQIAIGGLVVFAVAGGFILWQLFGGGKDQTAVNQQTVTRLVGEVSQIFVLPDGQPTVALIQDKGKLADQPFYRSAENGDYLLVYPKAKLALIYREKVHKLVNAGPIQVGDQSK
ncbi:MAG TPA: hypothetical protein VLG40_00640 [Candidatus Saccharimonas sp.]|nr:hypothetical protein [Candidatus Saccharimonas sp.]